VGNIAVGKSTAVKFLAQALGVQAFLEDPERNPHLRGFYEEDRVQRALDMQMWFLNDSIDRAKRVAAAGRGVQDRFAPENVEIFARQLVADGGLASADFALLDGVYRTASKALPSPDAVLLLDAAPAVIIERVKRRALLSQDEVRIAEADGLDEGYIARLRSRYLTFFADWQQSPVAVLDTTSVDTRVGEGRARLLATASAVLGGRGASAG
jgi:deoxyadenosine/deoxycytidine kinase